MGPSLTIIVPTLNSHHNLDNLVDSLVSQTYTNWSVLFVDGNSEPDHLRWLDSCCVRDNRFRWISQGAFTRTIYGAMNDGLFDVRDTDWILFWGSDDWAFSSDVFDRLTNSLSPSLDTSTLPCLIVCQGLYVNPRTNKAVRAASFLPDGLVSHSLFRLSLFLGRTPPHQATLFSPRVFNIVPAFDAKLLLASDLDFFLRLSKSSRIVIQSIRLPIVCMSPGGVSSRLPLKRLKEVALAYSRSFGPFFVVPFISRYIGRFLDLFLCMFSVGRKDHSLR